MLQDVFTNTDCSVIIGAELGNTALTFTPSLWTEQTFEHVFIV